MENSVAVSKNAPKHVRPEEVGGITLVELLVHPDKEVRCRAQEIVKQLLTEQPVLRLV